MIVLAGSLVGKEGAIQDVDTKRQHVDNVDTLMGENAKV
jgi:hypothetical protein